MSSPSRPPHALGATLVRRLTGRGGVVLFGSAARAFALGSQLVVLLVMSWMMPKAEFGDAMIVFTLYRLLGLGAGTGLGNLLLYHVGRSGGDPAMDVRLLRTLTLAGLAISGAVAVVFVVFADPIATAFQKPGLVPWLVHMSPMIIFGTMNFVTAGSFDGRSRITESIVLTEVAPNALRLLGFPIVAVLALPSVSIAHVLWLALALPWLWDVRRLFTTQVPGFARLTWWDIRYASWFTIYPMATQQLQGIDMLIVGALFSSTIAAEYSIASRLASFFPFLQYILIRTFAPRAGALHGSGDIDALNAELVILKRNSIISVYGLVGGILLGAPFALRLFGDYGAALPILLALSLPAVVRSIFAGVDAVLKMSGRAGFSSMVALGSAGIIVLMAYLTTPYIGIYALPVAMLLSVTLFSPVMTYTVGKSGVKILSWSDPPWALIPIATTCIALLQSNQWVMATISGLGLIMTALAAYFVPRFKLRYLTRDA